MNNRIKKNLKKLIAILKLLINNNFGNRDLDNKFDK